MTPLMLIPVMLTMARCVVHYMISLRLLPLIPVMLTMARCVSSSPLGLQPRISSARIRASYQPLLFQHLPHHLTRPRVAPCMALPRTPVRPVASWTQSGNLPARAAISGLSSSCGQCLCCLILPARAAISGLSSSCGQCLCCLILPARASISGL